MDRVTSARVEGKTKVVVVEPEGVNLFLPKPHAEILSLVLGKISGNPETTIRKYTDEIANALYSADFTFENIPGYHYGAFLDHTLMPRGGDPYREEKE